MTAFHIYQKFPIGWIKIPEAGRVRVNVSCLEGHQKEASLQAIHFRRILF